MRELTYNTLHRIAQIKNKADRIEEIRRFAAEVPAIALFIQYTYHPDVIFDLPEGDLPDTIFKRSGHDERGPFLQGVKKLKNFLTTSPVSAANKQRNFITFCETIASKDYELIIACKDKKLPWTQLSQKFCFQALPELFPTQPEKTPAEDGDEE